MDQDKNILKGSGRMDSIQIKVKVNGATELKRGKKIVDGDVVEYGSSKFSVSGKKA